MTKKKPHSENVKQPQLCQPHPKALVESAPPGTTKAPPDLSCRSKKQQAKTKRPALRQPRPAAPTAPVTTVTTVAAAPRETTRATADLSRHLEQQDAIEHQLFMAHPVRPLMNGWVLEIGHREVVVGCNSFTHWEYEGEYGVRWAVRIDGRLVRRLGLTGGVLVVETLEAVSGGAREKKGAQQLALPFDVPR